MIASRSSSWVCPRRRTDERPRGAQPQRRPEALGDAPHASLKRIRQPDVQAQNTAGLSAIKRWLRNDSAMGWESDIEAKHSMPMDQIHGHVYVLHYEVPQIAKSVSTDYAGPSPRADADGLLSATPIRHYVGWTQQRLPRKRINRHGPAALREIVYIQPGTTQDEHTMKLTGTCPKCGESLAASLSRPPGSRSA